jgi:NADH-quinone oxidoreductase subunit H
MTIKQLVIFLAKLLSLILPLLIAVAFLTLVERKVLAAQQLRVGPNIVGYLGLLQPIADAVKLLLKETVLPSPANRYLFILAPTLTFTLSIIAWVVIPISSNSVLVDINLGVSYIFAVSSLRCLWSYYS